jgi:hypothetical protein
MTLIFIRNRCSSKYFLNIITKVASTFIQQQQFHYVIQCVSDLRQIRDFLRILQFPPPIKLTATIYLKYFESDVENHTTTLVVIDIYCIGSFKSNFHMITTTTAPIIQKWSKLKVSTRVLIPLQRLIKHYRIPNDQPRLDILEHMQHRTHRTQKRLLIYSTSELLGPSLS